MPTFPIRGHITVNISRRPAICVTHQVLWARGNRFCPEPVLSLRVTLLAGIPYCKLNQPIYARWGSIRCGAQLVRQKGKAVHPVRRIAEFLSDFEEEKPLTC